MCWIHLAHDKNQYQIFVKNAMSFQATQKKYLFSNWMTISFLRRTLVQRVSLEKDADFQSEV